MASSSPKEYNAQADRLWKQMPAWNVLQVRWAENLLAVYENDLADISVAYAANINDADLRSRLQRAAAHVEILRFLAERMNTRVK